MNIKLEHKSNSHCMYKKTQNFLINENAISPCFLECVWDAYGPRENIYIFQQTSRPTVKI
jgi:hypothetical protein